MSWAGEALAALRKIITLEERVATLTDDIHELTRMGSETSTIDCSRWKRSWKFTNA